MSDWLIEFITFTLGRAFSFMNSHNVIGLNITYLQFSVSVIILLAFMSLFDSSLNLSREDANDSKQITIDKNERKNTKVLY